MAGMTAFAYLPGTTPLHRFPAGAKLLLLCAVSYAAFFAAWPGLAAAAAAIGAAAAVGRIGPRRLFAGSLPLAVSAVLIVALRGLTWSAADGWSVNAAELGEGLRFGGGLAAAFAAGSLLFAVTTTWELRAAVAAGQTAVVRPAAARLRRRFGRRGAAWAAGLESVDLSLLFALTLGFLPRVFAVWEAADEARRARAGRAGLAALAEMLPLVLERLMEAAAETAAAVEARSGG